MGDSQKNVLIAAFLLLNWVEILVFQTHENIAGFLFGSLFLLPIAYLIFVYLFNIGIKFLVFVGDNFGERLDEYSAELIIIYASLPVWIIFSLVSFVLKSLHLYDEILILAHIIYQGYLLYRGVLVPADLIRKKAAFLSAVYLVLPILFYGLYAAFMINVWR